MSERRVLFIVEGKKTEPRFLKHSHSAILGTSPENIFSYNTNIHDLISRFMPNGIPDENLELTAVLRERDDGTHEGILSQDYALIYLIFDMDPQDPRYDPKLLMDALSYFNNPTENGKLYLNYPMMESYRHIMSDNFIEYRDSKTPMRKGTSYKKTVECEGMKRLSDISKCGTEDFLMIMGFNLRKTNYLLSKQIHIPTACEYECMDLSEILRIQDDLFRKESSIYVLNTSILNIIDFNPSKIIDLLAQHNVIAD